MLASGDRISVTAVPHLRRIAARPGVALAAVVAVVLILSAVTAPLIAPQNPFDLATLSIADAVLPPGDAGLSGVRFWFGSDDQGRDMLSAILYGLRISLMVGFASTFLALIIGSVFGLVSAYAGRAIDAVMMRIVDMQLSMPSILVALIILAILGHGADRIVAALVIVQWAYYARTMRSIALSESRREYIAAARCLRLPTWRIILRHLLPNCIGPVMVVAAMQFAHAISLEATLSFLGLGLPITKPSLGLLIANGYSYVLNGKYWISLFPGLVLLALLFSMNIITDRLSELLDPRRTK